MPDAQINTEPAAKQPAGWWGARKDFLGNAPQWVSALGACAIVGLAVTGYNQISPLVSQIGPFLSGRTPGGTRPHERELQLHVSSFKPSTPNAQARPQTSQRLKKQ